jgi:serine/threonine-protein kinase
VLQGGTYGRYVPTGHLVYASGGALLAARFDLDRMQVTGPAMPVLKDVGMQFYGTGVGQFSFSAAGQLVYVAGYARAVETSLVWVDRRGNVQPATAERRTYTGMRSLPDGHSVVLEIDSPTTTDLWRLDFLRGALTRLTFEKDNYNPVLSPDGERVAFSSTRMGRANLFVVPTMGGPTERLTTAREEQIPSGWSPDGRELAFSQFGVETKWDIWVLPLTGDRKPRPLVVTPFSEGGAVFSPDGHWVAYNSSESGESFST